MKPAGRARPKYALAELERRWLVIERRLAGLELGAAHVIRDRYLDGARLRLRRMGSPAGGVVHKLCKKYGDASPGAESVTNLYLSASEYALLETLPGWVVEKLRYRCLGGSLDHYQRDGDALWVFEREFADPGSADAFPDPLFAGREITADADFTGAALARRFGSSSIH